MFAIFMIHEQPRRRRAATAAAIACMALYRSHLSSSYASRKWKRDELLYHAFLQSQMGTSTIGEDNDEDEYGEEDNGEDNDEDEYGEEDNGEDNDGDEPMSSTSSYRY